MAWQVNRGLKNSISLLHNIAVVLWAVFSTFVFSSAVIAVRPISGRWSRGVARVWCRQLLAVARVKLHVEGLSKIEKNRNYVFVANHQGYFDIPVLYAGLGSAISFIAKKELFSIPFMGWGMAAIGCIKLDRKNARKAKNSIIRAARLLKKSNFSLVLFPEGGTSPTGAVGEFKRGSFALALEAGVPVVPVAISGTRTIYRKATYRINPGTVFLRIGSPIATGATATVGKGDLSELTRESIIRELREIPVK